MSLKDKKMDCNICDNNILAIIYNNNGPYHLQRLSYISKFEEMYAQKVKKVIAIELASQEIIHPWKTDNISPEITKHTVFPERVIEEIPAWQLARGTWSILNRLNPQALAIGPSRESLAAWLTALFWSRVKKRVAVLMMDSKHDDAPRGLIKEWGKKQIISRFDAALVGGSHSEAYARLMGLPPERIFVGCDVVDNDYFACGADRARQNAADLRQQYSLPENYFLYVGRLDEKKNVSRLLQAYARYVKTAPADRSWHLVLCGSGPLEDQLRQEARQLGLSQVIFAGFTQIDALPSYYGLARCLVVPSSHSEQWGLVVNEAMASGLPVLVSRACGCAPDLVQEGVNGYTFDPYDTSALMQLMLKMSSGDVDLEAMGEVSYKIIANWSLETYAQNLFKAVEAGGLRKAPLRREKTSLG